MTCPACGELEKGQHSADCPRIESEVSHSESEQVDLGVYETAKFVIWHYVVTVWYYTAYAPYRMAGESR